MKKSSFILFTFVLTFWLIISGEADLQHLMAGILISLLTVWFWKDLNKILPTILRPREIFLFLHCMAMLVGYVIKSNIDVAKKLLFSDLSSASIFLELEPGLKSDWGRVMLATCITITPGTITLDVDPETSIFTVHALTQETGISLYYWRLITEIRNLETLVQRRGRNAIDYDGIHDFDSTGTTKSGTRTHRD